MKINSKCKYIQRRAFIISIDMSMSMNVHGENIQRTGELTIEVSKMQGYGMENIPMLVEKEYKLELRRMK